jgi:hypothetical protein
MIVSALAMVGLLDWLLILTDVDAAATSEPLQLTSHNLPDKCALDDLGFDARPLRASRRVTSLYCRRLAPRGAFAPA